MAFVTICPSPNAVLNPAIAVLAAAALSATGALSSAADQRSGGEMLQANPYGRCNPAFDAAAAHHPLFRPGKPEFVSLKTCGRTERKKYDPEKDKTDDAGIVIAILLGVFIVVYFGHLYLEEEEELKKYRR